LCICCSVSLAQGEEGGYLSEHVEWNDDMYTPLHYAASMNDLEVVEELIRKYHIPVEIKTGDFKRTPLHLAALEGH
jgi:ankyrin repeat protein